MNDSINKNQIEVKTYKERVKDILCENQGHINNSLLDKAQFLKKSERDNRYEQYDFKKDVNVLNKKIREKMTLLEQHLISASKANFEQWRDNRLDIERDLNELKIIYGHRIDELRNMMDEERKFVISNLEEE